MSKMHIRSTAMNVLNQMNLAPVMVAPRHVSNLTDNFHAMNSCAEDDHEAKSDRAMRESLAAAYGLSDVTKDKPFVYYDGTAVIPIHGTLINRYAGYYYGYVTGYNFIRRQAAAAVADEDVSRIIFDVNSNGGQVAGCFELAAELAAIEKPTMAVVDANCYSAAYALASAADSISVTPSGGAGSVGVIAMHVDVSKAMNDFGVKMTLITAGEHKADGNPYEALPDSVRKDIQAEIDTTYASFVSLVAANRGIDEKVVRDTEARCYSAQEAKALGLIDAVATPDEAATAFISGPSGPDESNGDETMPQPNNASTAPDATQAAAASAEQLATARAEGATAERGRISGIMGSEAAKQRPTLASHIAFNTSMSAEDANTMLSAAAVETAAAAPTKREPAQAPETAASTSNFQKAMDGGSHPNVGADGGATDAAAAEDDLEANLASFNYKFN